MSVGVPRQLSPRTVASKEAAYANLQQAILTGELRPGAPLSERALAERYHLSRTPIREILQRMHHEGLVEVVRNRGAFVRHLTAEQLRDIFYAREAVEGMAARLAAVRHDPEGLVPIEEAFQKLRVEATTESLARMVETGRRLHDFVVAASRNELLKRAYDTLRGQAMLIRAITRNVFAIERASYGEHLEILNAIRARRDKAAERSMCRHLTATRERVLRQMFGKY